MDTTAEPGVSVQEALGNIASSSPEKFSLFFRRVRKMFPDDVAEACLWLVASRGLDTAGRNMALWLAFEGKYINILIESEGLPIEVASKAAAALKTIDPQFLIRFSKAAEQLTSPPSILRALGLVSALGDYSILVAWLRKLCHHSDERIRSRAVKVLCELRPNKGLIERQMSSEEPRVRANAIEALWHSRTPESGELFKSAAADANHRVVANALVGLHLHGDQSAIAKMTDLCEHSNPLFRTAMAWCFGFILDRRAIPVLLRLSSDPSALVRKRALQSLLALESQEEMPAPVVEVLETKPEPQPVKEPEVDPMPETKPGLAPRFATLS